jgi:hypothetical protein
VKIAHQWTNATASIRIEGLAQKTHVLHVTDSHIGLCDDRNADWQESSVSLRERFAKYHCTATGRTVGTEVTFDATLKSFANHNVDLVALTGDIVHLPSKASVEFTAAALKSAGMPWLYTSGNHDWCYGGQPFCEQTRRDFWPALQPLHNGPAACHVQLVNGLCFVSVDNSAYQVDAEQLEFVKTQLNRKLPTVLLIHIPLSLPTLRAPAIARWGSPILMGDPDWSLEQRKKWGTGLDAPETLECIRMLTAAPNLAAVLCGHIHFPHADNINPMAVQYVGAPGFEGGTRLVEFDTLVTT